MLGDNYFFDNTPKHRGQDLARWFVSHAFKQGICHAESFKNLIRDTKATNASFMSSPIVGLTLMRAVNMNRSDIILGLLAEGADVNMMFSGRCILHEAVKTNNELMLGFALSLPGVQKDLFNVDMRTPLMEAAKGRPACLRILLEAGCDLSLRDQKGNTALHHAFSSQRAHRDDVLACLDVMHDFGVDINSYGSQYHTCLQKAAETGNHRLIRWLVQHNCSLEAPAGHTDLRTLYNSQSFHKLQKTVPVLIAFRRGNRVLVEVLIACGCEFRKFRPMLEYSQSHRLLHASLVEAFSKVDSLQALCRKTVRAHLSTHIEAESHHLCLPEALRRYVLCTAELTYLDSPGVL